VVTFTAGESVAKILAALQQGVIPTSLVDVGANAAFRGAHLSTDEVSNFRLGGAVADSAVLTATDGLNVTAGTAPKHIIRITQEGEIPVGSYPLIDYSGTIGGLGYAGLQLAPLPGRIAGHLVNNIENSTIDLEITGSQGGDITWTGTGGGTWDVEGNKNWVFTGGSTTTAFFAGDLVRFGDSASTGNVTVAQTLTPSSLVVDNTTRDYVIGGAAIGGSSAIEKYGAGSLTFTNDNTHTGSNYLDSGIVRVGDGGGSGALGTGMIFNNTTLIINRTGTLEMPNIISGEGSLEKLGSGTLVLGGNSSFTGPVTITAGIIASGHANSLGSTAVGTTITAGATLDAYTGGFGEEPILVSGAGVGGLGAIVNNGVSQNQNAAKKLTLASDSTFGGASRWDVRGNGSFVDGNFKLTKTGTNQISLVQATVSVKNIEITGGLLSVEYGASVNNTNPGTITVTAGTLGFGSFGNPISCSKPIILNGGSINTTWNGNDGSAAIASTIALSAPSNVINVQGGSTITVTGAVSGTGALQKTGPGTLFLTAAPGYAGDTNVPEGAFMLAQGGLADASSVRLGSEATLNLAFSGTDTVKALFIGGVQQPAGVYNSTNSNGRIIGSGSLTVTSSPAGYADWAATNGIAGAGGREDSDGDGIPNGIEFVIGGDPSGPGSDSNSLLPTSTKNATHLVFSFRRSEQSDANAPHAQYGSDLSGWTTAVNGLDGVTIETSNISSGIDLVTVRVPLVLANGSKLFARLAVDIP
jgi:autotransporter-associated beta strand protein